MIDIISHHPRSTLFLLDAFTPGTSIEDTVSMLWGYSNSQPLGDKPSALAIDLNSSKASAGKGLRHPHYIFSAGTRSTCVQ